MQLRDYQTQAIDAVKSSMKSKKRHLIVLPTGSGKTVIFCSLAKQQGLKTLVLAHTYELLDQVKKTAKILDYRNIYAKSVQSSFKENSLVALENENFDLIIVDECHRSHAKSYNHIINHFPNSHILGVTATPFRNDKKRLEDIFGDSIFSKDLIDMIQKGYLCDFEGYRVRTKVSLDSIRRVHGDFTVNGLSAVVNVVNRNELIVNEYMKISPKEKALCFCCDIAHSNALAKEFQKRGIASAALHGGLPKKVRADLLEKFKSGEIQVVTNCQILTEGFDEPSIKCLIMGRPTCSKVLYMQMIGRGSRIFPDKETCKVIEFTDNDFDVCFLEDIIEKKIKNFRIRDGEKLLSGFERAKKDLTDIGTETEVQKHIVIPKTIYERMATPWQMQELDRRGIDYLPPLSEFVANHLLQKGI